MFKSPAIRLLTLAILTLLLLIPLGTVRSLISERQQRAYEAENAIAAQWGGEQVLGAAWLEGTVTQKIEQDGKTRVVQSQLVLLPDTLEIDSSLAPEVRHRGIFALPVYRSSIKVKARFDPDELESMRAAVDKSQPLQLKLGISDTRGVQALGAVKIGGDTVRFAANRHGLAGLASLGAEVPADASRSGDGVVASYELELAGARAQSFLPLGRTTRVTMRSPWPHPSFDGSYLPAKSSVRPDGFEASWQVLEFNRAYPQTFAIDSVGQNEISASAFGLTLYQPAGLYQQNERSGKYGLLMIALVFCALFLFEVLERLALHPIQYGLFGLALALFYLLLLALSEHVGFKRAYALAAVGAVALVGGYARAVLGSTRRAALLGAMQLACYGVFFVLVKSEDYSLLLGAATLFAVLALVMFLTRKMDWTRLALDDVR
jgi:inner membrane protein